MGKGQPNPAKRWCFTWHDYPDDWNKQLQRPTVAGYIVGREICPTTGRKHLQGYIETKEKTRPTALGLPKCVHWEVARGNRKANEAYCTKEQNCERWGIFYQYKYDLPGAPYPWQQELLDIIKTEPDPRQIYWIWETEGNTGKSVTGKWIESHSPRVLPICGKAGDMLAGVAKFKEQTGEVPRTILVNCPRSMNLDFLSWQGLEQIKDMFFFSGKYETAVVNGPFPHIIITSNEPPPRHKLSADRWRVAQIVDRKLRWE